MSRQPKRVAVYARLSVATDASVSIARQVEAAEQYAAARGWEVVETFIDDGVSATHNRPEARAGWGRLLGSPEQFDAVVVWKIDRLARRVLDFLHAHEALQDRGAVIVAVEDPIDMTTPQGRFVAQMLAGFGEMEAAAISARVKASRDHLIHRGRVVGGTVPYGWRAVPNPDGPGKVLAHDPERIGYVREAAERVLGGATVYAVVQWLDDAGAPLPSTSQAARTSTGWTYSTVERLLRNPVLAGMRPYQPGRGRRDPADPAAVLRDPDGLPVVDDTIAVISAEQRRRLLALLDTRDTPQARPRASKGTTSVLLSRLVTCGHCDRLMQRGTVSGRPALSCPRCHQTISRNQLDPHIVGRLLAERGDCPVWKVTTIADTTSTRVRLADIEAAIRDTAEAMTRDDADVVALGERLASLKRQRSQERRAEQGDQGQRMVMTAGTVERVWGAAADDEARREVLVGQVDSLVISRGGVGRRLDPERVVIQWREVPPVMSREVPSHLAWTVDAGQRAS